MNIKRWPAIVVAVLALVACGSPTVQPVARLDNVVLSRQEVDQRIERIKKGLEAQPAQGQPAPSTQDLERAIVGQFIQQNITLNLARQKGITITDKAVDDWIEQARAGIVQQGGTLEAAVQDQLGLPGAASSEFRQFASFFLAREKLGETLVTTDTVRQEMTAEIMDQVNTKTDQVHSAHILVATEEEAQKVLDRLAQGEKFEDLARELSTDTGSGANGGDLPWFPRGQGLAPEFEKAIFDDLKPGEMTTTPVKTDFGYHIIKVIEHAERSNMTEEQANQMIEQGIAQQLESKRQQAVQQLIDEEQAKAKSEGRLVEPTYPDPTAEPIEPAPPDTAPAEPTTAP